MTSFKLLFITLFSLFPLNNETNAQINDIAGLVSPCPHLFEYLNTEPPDKWHGIITLRSDTDVQGIRLRVVFDRPPLKFGNFFGDVVTSDNIDFLVKNRYHQLKAHVPLVVPFYIKFKTSAPAPKLVAFWLNSKQLCPEGPGTEAPATTVEPISGDVSPEGPGTEVPATTVEPISGDVSSEGPGTEVPATIVERISGDVSSTSKPMDYGGDAGENNDGGRGSNSGAGGERRPFSKKTTEDVRPPTLDREEEVFSLEDFYSEDFNYFFNQPNNPQTPVQPTDDEDLNAICGTVAQPKFLTNGQEVEVEGEFPWHAALYYTKAIDLAFICGASLISQYHVITAAHCVTRSRSQTPLNSNNLLVYLGKYYLRRYTSPGIQDRQVSKILPHPEYNAQTYGNDIALVKLTKPADFTDYVRPVCLWQESAELTSMLNKQGNVVGWGFDEAGKVTETLIQVEMPVVSHETCLFSYPDFYSRFSSCNTYCAGFRNGTSICSGDSGGGMVFPKPSSNRNNPIWQLRGLVSISVALQNQLKCDTSHYVVFTDAAKYLDWIKESLVK